MPAVEAPRRLPGLPAGIVERVLEILRSSAAPVRRRRLLEQLEQRGHRISLAGLNRVLQHCREAGLTVEDDSGVRVSRPP